MYTYGIELLLGRKFSRNSTPGAAHVIVNPSAGDDVLDLLTRRWTNTGGPNRGIYQLLSHHWKKYKEAEET